MKKTKHLKRQFFMAVSVMVFLIALGVVLVVDMFHEYSELILGNTDNQLISLARSVDRSAESQLERYTENLLHTIEHSERAAAEEQWKKEREEDILLSFLEHSLLGQDKTIVDILVLRGTEVVLSVSGEKEYLFSTYGTEQEGNVWTCLCRSSEGQLTIAGNSDITGEKYGDGGIKPPDAGICTPSAVRDNGNFDFGNCT